MFNIHFKNHFWTYFLYSQIIYEISSFSATVLNSIFNRLLFDTVNLCLLFPTLIITSKSIARQSFLQITIRNEHVIISNVLRQRYFCVGYLYTDGGFVLTITLLLCGYTITSICIYITDNIKITLYLTSLVKCYKNPVRLIRQQ